MNSDTPPPSDAGKKHPASRPGRWTVTVAMGGTLAVLCMEQLLSARITSTHMSAFVTVWGTSFALAWLAGMRFTSSSGRWFCIVWALLAAWLFIDAQRMMDHAEARGLIRCGNTLTPVLLWTFCLPPAMLFVAWRRSTP